MNHIVLMAFTVVAFSIIALVVMVVSGSDWLNAVNPVLAARLRGAVRSKTIWLNALGAALIEQLPSAMPDILAQVPALQPLIPDNVYQPLMAGMIVINILMRFHVRVPLEAK